MNATTLPVEPFGAYRASFLQRLILGLSRIPPLYRGAFRWTWVRLVDAIRSGPLDVRSRYGLFRVHPTTNLVESAILLHPNYNREEIEFLMEGLGRDGTFVDIGANIGLYSVALGRHLSDGGRVVAIEPNPVCCERLRLNLAFNGLDRAVVCDVAVGDFSGRGKLKIHHNDLAIAQTVRDDASGDFEVRTLVSVLDGAGVGRIGALKIDVEGFEMAALGPFFATAPASRWPARICMEHLGDKADITELLRSKGYRLIRNTRNNSLLVRDPASA